jgi:predicted permease
MSTPHRRRFVSWILGLELYLCPPSFRRRFGPEIKLMAQERAADVREEQGRAAAAIFWIAEIMNLLVAARREWGRALRTSAPKNMQTGDEPVTHGRRNTRRTSPSGRDARRKYRRGAIKRALHAVLQDLRYALRQLAKHPGFTAIAVISLAIGIGANTAVFSVVNAVLIRSRPYEAPEELVHIYTRTENGSDYGNSSYQDLIDLRSLEDLFVEVGAFAGRTGRVRIGDETFPVMVEPVTHNLFPLLGIRAALGRTFLPEEDVVPGAHAVVILGHGYWQRVYAGDSTILGQTVDLAGRPFTIVGVMPEQFESLFVPGVRTDVFVPMLMTASLAGDEEPGLYSDRRVRGIKIIARLRRAVRVEHARAQVAGLSQQLKVNHPETYETRSFNVVPTPDVQLQPDVDAGLAYVATLLMTMVGLVLLLTCTNLAGFLLARGTDRKREIAVRLALGARRGRLVTQLLTETVLLGIIGSAVGLGVAQWGLNLLTGFVPPTYFPITVDHRIDGTVLIFTIAVATAAGVLAGLAPAIKTTKPDVASTLKDEAVTGRTGGLGLHSGLVALQIAISIVLLVGGGLFIRTLQVANDVDPGFTTEDGGIVWVDLGASGLPRHEWTSTTERLAEEARSLPGVAGVGLSNGIPLSVGTWRADYVVPGVDPPEGRHGHRVVYYSIDSEFFDAMGIALVAGRGITTFDRDGTEPVVVVSETAARRFWPGADPLGREVITLGSNRVHRVVGVARDVKIERPDEDPQPLFYLSYAQTPVTNVRLIARGLATPRELAATLRDVVRAVDDDLVILAETTMGEQLSLVLFPSRLAAGLLGVFGVMALTLAIIGLYGVVSFAVSRRTQEVGIRMALGANTGAVVGMVVRGAMGVVLVGVATGLVAAWFLAQLLSWFLVGVQPRDPITLVSVPLLLCGVALLAAFVPARRASKVSPVQALRYD